MTTFYSVSPDFRKIIAFYKFPMLRQFVLPVRATCIRRWVWSNGGMIETGQNLSMGEKAAPLPVWNTTNLTGTDLESNPGLLRERPATNCSENQTELELHLKNESVPRSKHYISVIKTSQLMQYREIIAVCSQIRTKHINTLCGQNVELMNVKLVVHIVTTGL